MSEYRHPADRPEVVPTMPAEEVIARLGCDPASIDAQARAEELARALVMAMTEDDTEALDLVLAGYIDECADPAEALVRALFAAARLASDLGALAAFGRRTDPGRLLFRQAEFREAGHDHMRAAVEALLSDAPAEDLDPEVDAIRAGLRHDAYIAAATEDIDVDAAERLDLELRALIEAAAEGVEEVAPDEETGH
jgi:enoyl-CoA hydratase/carnithine racemase